MQVDAKAIPPNEPFTAQILAETAPLADEVYPVHSPVDPRFPIHTRLGTVEVFPDTMTPASWSSTGSGISRVMQRCAIEMGILSDKEKIAFQGIFYGRCATNISSYLFINRRLPGAPWLPWTKSARAIIQPHADPIVGWAPPHSLGAWLVDCWWRLRGRKASRQLEIDLQTEAVQREAELERAERDFVADSFEGLDAKALFEEMKKPSLNGVLVRLHSLVTIYVGSNYMRLAEAIARYTTLPAIQTANALLVGLGDVESAKPARELQGIAVHVRAAPRLCALLKTGKLEAFAAALACPQDDAERKVAEARAEFLREYGHRGIGEASFEATTWAEDPSQADSLLALYLDEAPAATGGSAAERREAVEKEIFAQISSPATRAKMRSCITAAQTFAALRERTKSMSVRQSLRTRRLLRVLTRKLVEAGIFTAPDDREMLSFKELTAVLKTEPATLRTLIARRRQAYELLKQLDTVETTFHGVPTPRLSGIGGGALAAAGTVLPGLGISPGCIEGIACVVGDPRLGADLKPGEILVAPYTDAAWSPLFLLASGIVIDSATLISHGATVAREFGLPAVANVPGTSSIQTGDRIRVDANKGEVHILERGTLPVPKLKAADTPANNAATFAFDSECFAVLRALRLKGHAIAETLSGSTDLSVPAIATILATAHHAGLCEEIDGTWRATPAGLDWVESHLPRERPDHARAESLHESFLPLNALFKQLAFDWQMRGPEKLNDHTDAAYDAAVLERLYALHARMLPVAHGAAALVPRLTPYARRLDEAVAKVKAGDVKYFMSPRVESYHTVWFEFHEELIAMTGRTRAAEAAAGRAA